MRRDDRRRDRDNGRRKVRPRVEGLEGRFLLYAATGGSWPHPNVITFSFVPDGTNVAGSPSNLFQTFNAKWSTATWEGAFVQAAAIWEQVANVNFVQVSDNGTPMGGGAYQQGDPHMGDIRISGLPTSVLGSSTLAYTLLPPQINGGSEAGDIVFNTSQSWQINSNYDLLTVAIHEFGHALGLGESQVQQAVMYGTYTGINQSLAPDDVAGVDSIYGPRQPDVFMALYNDVSATTAANLTPFLTPQGQFGYNAFDLQNPNQSEWFKVTVPANPTGSMTVTMQSTNLSELSPGFLLYNSSLQFVGSTGTFNTYGNTVSYKLNGVVPGQTYYIQGFGDGFNQNSDGNYGLQVNFSSSPLYPFPIPSTPTLDTVGLNGGGQFEKTGRRGTDPDPSWLRRIDRMADTDGGRGDSQSAIPFAQVGSTGPILLIAPPVSSDSAVSTGLSTPGGPLQAGKTSLWARSAPSLN